MHTFDGVVLIVVSSAGIEYFVIVDNPIHSITKPDKHDALDGQRADYKSYYQKPANPGHGIKSWPTITLRRIPQPRERRGRGTVWPSSALPRQTKTRISTKKYCVILYIHIIYNFTNQLIFVY